LTACQAGSSRPTWCCASLLSMFSIQLLEWQPLQHRARHLDDGLRAIFEGLTAVHAQAFAGSCTFKAMNHTAQLAGKAQVRHMASSGLFEVVLLREYMRDIQLTHHWASFRHWPTCTD
jgi:hypothetical protein